MTSGPGSRLPRTWRAPGRVNLIGDHTDYQDGWCLPMAVDRECRVTVDRPSGTTVRARSAQVPGTVAVAADGTTDPETVDPPWGRFVAGAVAACTTAAIPVAPCDLTVTSTVPLGSGLSSSSALSVALVRAFADLAGV
ncbi:MAG: galactokinase family protein, partial [Actinomycetota bacterium]